MTQTEDGSSSLKSSGGSGSPISTDRSGSPMHTDDSGSPQSSDGSGSPRCPNSGSLNPTRSSNLLNLFKPRLTPPRLDDIPPELAVIILRRLDPFSLVSVSATCRKLRLVALDDSLWRPLVEKNAGKKLTLSGTGPCRSFQELYAAHDLHWFLTKNKIWFTEGRDMHGKVVLTRFNPATLSIEGYQLVARNTAPATDNQSWGSVICPAFRPEVSLHLARPILLLPPRTLQTPISTQRYETEIPMDLQSPGSNVSGALGLARPMDDARAVSSFTQPYPYDRAWPPRTTMAKHHISAEPPLLRPQCRSEIWDEAFYLHTWVRTPFVTNDAAVAPWIRRNMQVDHRANANGFHGVDSIVSYATVSSHQYTPMTYRPWRGIWVGDYGAHGPEFVVIQHEEEGGSPTDSELGISRGPMETDEGFEEKRLDARTYRGNMRAVKLTGDFNVPRGEVSWEVDMFGDGLKMQIEDGPFEGLPTFGGVGRIANQGYSEVSLIDIQLIIISNDRLAVWWKELQIVNMYVRVNIDKVIADSFH